MNDVAPSSKPRMRLVNGAWVVVTPAVVSDPPAPPAATLTPEQPNRDDIPLVANPESSPTSLERPARNRQDVEAYYLAEFTQAYRRGGYKAVMALFPCLAKQTCYDIAWKHNVKSETAPQNRAKETTVLQQQAEITREAIARIDARLGNPEIIAARNAEIEATDKRIAEIVERGKRAMIKESLLATEPSAKPVAAISVTKPAIVSAKSQSKKPDTDAIVPRVAVEPMQPVSDKPITPEEAYRPLNTGEIELVRKRFFNYNIPLLARELRRAPSVIEKVVAEIATKGFKSSRMITADDCYDQSLGKGR